ncbi:uncharacterized protein LOC126576259 [Anopheles aquasalis]|uniref:uncharacterized protein LOC126576259 n=1 Tax=Anopheles aquasalis TaxID=42839 RepID=UPI00215ACD7B|nr:uncharacterized protein LOC126576259 [Anopheles aquasalis]
MQVYQRWSALSSSDQTVNVLQLLVDMTGFQYVLHEEDVDLLRQNARNFEEERIINAPFEAYEFLKHPKHLANLDEFCRNLIVRPCNELLANNECINSMITLTLAFCASKQDECVMVGTFFGSIQLEYLCAAQRTLLGDLERAIAIRDGERQQLLQRKQRYIDDICISLFRYCRAGLSFEQLCVPLTERFCRLLITFSDRIVLHYNELQILADIMKVKCKKALLIVLRCLKDLLDNEPADERLQNRVALFILCEADLLVRVMYAYKQLELSVLNLLLKAHRQIGTQVFSEDVATKIAFRIFTASQEPVVNTSIDLLTRYYTAITPADELECKMLVDLLQVFQAHELPLATLDRVVEKLWIKGFFKRFEAIFQLLMSLDISVDTFLAKCVVHTIAHCHEMLVDDIKEKISPDPHRVTLGTRWGRIRERILSFVAVYPKTLRDISVHPEHFVLLLNPLQPEYNEYYGMCGVNCEAYCVEVFYKTLLPIALDCGSFSVLYHTLATIYRYDRIMHISEEIWQKLTNEYADNFFCVRSHLRRYNLGIDRRLMNSYDAAITRLCVLIEINSFSRDIDTLVEYLANDLRLLERMELSIEGEMIFFRLYKNTLYVLVNRWLENPAEFPAAMTERVIGRRVGVLMTELVSRLQTTIDLEFSGAMHLIVAFCDLMILLQPSSQIHQMTETGNIVFQVEETLLETLGSAVEWHVFNNTDPDTLKTLLSQRKHLLGKYIAMYRLHGSLPHSMGPSHVVLHYGRENEFEMELEQLLLITFRAAVNNRFNDIISHAFLSCFLTRGNIMKGKVFIDKIHEYQLKCLPDENSSAYSFGILRSIAQLLLEQNDTHNGGNKNSIFPKVLKAIKPWTLKLPTGTRKEL